MRYCSPEHPPPTTLTRRPPHGFSATNCLILLAAFSESEIMKSQLDSKTILTFGHFARFGMTLAFLPILDRSFDRVFGKHRAMDFYRRQIEFLDDDAVLDLQRFFVALAFDQLGDVAGAGDRTAAAESLE